MNALLNETAASTEHDEAASVAAPKTPVPPLKTPGLVKIRKNKAPSSKSGPIADPTPIEPHDQMDDHVHEIENLSKKDALERIEAVQEQLDESYFILGGLLSKVQVEGWFKPHKNLEAFVEAEYGFSGRKARYFIEIYEKLGELALPIAQFKGVGWTKMRMVVRVLTKENAEYWAKTAAENSKGEFEKLVQAALAKSGNQMASVSNATHRKVFKLHDDQIETVNAAIEKVKKDTGTECDAVALEIICIDFQSGMNLLDRVRYCNDEVLRRVMIHGARMLGHEASSNIIAEVFPAEKDRDDDEEAKEDDTA